MEIDRMAMADCFTVDEVLACLCGQIPIGTIPVPVEEIAYGVGIQEIRKIPSQSFEAVLLCDVEKQNGSIAVRQDSIPTRQRFSIGHELGHFLIPTHFPDEQGFLCKNIGNNYNAKDNLHEKEADFFSANLLMPSHLVRQDVLASGEPDLGQIVSLAQRYDVSIESFIRRYLVFCEYSCCAVFSQNNIVRYPSWTDGFPFLNTRKGLPIPRESYAASCNQEDGYITEVEESDPIIWLADEGQKLPNHLYEQSLCQTNGFKVTLIWFDQDLENDDDQDVEWAPPSFK